MSDLRISELTQRTPDGTEYMEVIIPPFTPGTNRKVLLSDLAAIFGGSGDVTKVGTPANNQVGVWTGDGTIEGTADLTYDGNVLDFILPSGGVAQIFSNAGASYFGSIATAPEYAAGFNAYSEAAKAKGEYVNVYTGAGAWRAGIALDNLLLDGTGADYPAVGGNYFFDTKASSAGLQYAADYSANYTSRSLVDKGYVDTRLYSGNFSGAGTATTVFTVTIGATMANSTYEVAVTPTAALSAALFYVTNKTTTTFDVTYLAGLTGTVTFDWILRP